MTVSDAFIDACGFRMFELPEIARTMVMHAHPGGGDYVVRGNKREVMAQYGNAVTPPATAWKLARLGEVLGGGFTFTDLFCGAGGSSIGATIAGGELRLGLNHWRRAIETHAENFPYADHDCADVSALTTAQIRRYPDSDVLLASPECTNHSMRAGGFHHGIVLRNNTPRGDSGWMATSDVEPFRTLTASCTQSLVVPYQSEPHAVGEPARTITTRDRLALVVPVTQTRPALVEIPEASS